MTEDELTALATKWASPPRYDGYDDRQGENYWDYRQLLEDSQEGVAALLAEVRRLRAGIEAAADTMTSSQPELAHGELWDLLR